MDRAIVTSTLLLVALTWLLYKLIVLLAGGDKRNDETSKPDAGSDGAVSGVSRTRQKPIHQRLRRGVNK